jgi:hypothetical protein
MLHPYILAERARAKYFALFRTLAPLCSTTPANQRLHPRCRLLPTRPPLPPCRRSCFTAHPPERGSRPTPSPTPLPRRRRTTDAARALVFPDVTGAPLPPTPSSSPTPPKHLRRQRPSRVCRELLLSPPTVSAFGHAHYVFVEMP